MQEIFFGGWESLLRTLIVAALAYPAMLTIVRLTGHRSLAQMNAFDLIVTIALGSVLSSVITSKDVALSQGILAFALLLSMQFGLSWMTSHSETAEGIINGEPVMLVHQGQLLSHALRKARISDEEIRAMVRTQGLASMADVEAVVLETNGKLSVVRRKSEGQPSALVTVPHYSPTPEFKPPRP